MFEQVNESVGGKNIVPIAALLLHVFNNISYYFLWIIVKTLPFSGILVSFLSLCYSLWTQRGGTVTLHSLSELNFIYSLML